jgi:hypothetical protein
MSVLAILAIIWWGICGFLSVVVGAWAVISVLGPTGRLVLVLVVGTVGGHLLERYLTADERCANDFLTSWAATSANFPDGRLNTREIGEFLDFDRLGGVNPYLGEHWRLRYHSKVTAAGNEVIIPKGDPAPVKTEVYLSNVRVHSSEQEIDFTAKLRVWVARDNDKVVRFEFESIVFK